MDMSSYNLTINVGSDDEGKKRDEAYRKAAKDESLSLAKWIKKHMDPIARFKYEKDDSRR
jgi:hypothetical protein